MPTENWTQLVSERLTRGDSNCPRRERGKRGGDRRTWHSLAGIGAPQQQQRQQLGSGARNESAFDPSAFSAFSAIVLCTFLTCLLSHLKICPPKPASGSSPAIVRSAARMQICCSAK